MKVFGIAGYSGSGKTTLIERVLPQFAARSLKVAVIKHTHHDFDIDRPGKDSWRAREAGATAVLLASDHRTALLTEHRDAPPRLDSLLAQLPPCDLVLVEGYKREAIPKLELEVETVLGTLDATHKVPRHPGLPQEEHRGFPAPLPLSPFYPPDLDRRVDSPALSGRGSRPSGRTSG